MAVLRAARRNKLAKSQFGLPGQRAYPINDPAHARNALARASQQKNAGNLSQSQYEQIAAKAHRFLNAHKDKTHKAGKGSK
jgi:hypothetical protein